MAALPPRVIDPLYAFYQPMVLPEVYVEFANLYEWYRDLPGVQAAWKERERSAGRGGEDAMFAGMGMFGRGAHGGESEEERVFQEWQRQREDGPRMPHGRGRDRDMPMGRGFLGAARDAPAEGREQPFPANVSMAGGWPCICRAMQAFRATLAAYGRDVPEIVPVEMSVFVKAFLLLVRMNRFIDFHLAVYVILEFEKILEEKFPGMSANYVAPHLEFFSIPKDFRIPFEHIGAAFASNSSMAVDIGAAYKSHTELRHFAKIAKGMMDIELSYLSVFLIGTFFVGSRFEIQKMATEAFKKLLEIFMGPKNSKPHDLIVAEFCALIKTVPAFQKNLSFMSSESINHLITFGGVDSIFDVMDMINFRLFAWENGPEDFSPFDDSRSPISALLTKKDIAPKLLFVICACMFGSPVKDPNARNTLKEWACTCISKWNESKKTLNELLDECKNVAAAFNGGSTKRDTFFARAPHKVLEIVNDAPNLNPRTLSIVDFSPNALLSIISPISLDKFSAAFLNSFEQYVSFHSPSQDVMCLLINKLGKGRKAQYLVKYFIVNTDGLNKGTLSTEDFVEKVFRLSMVVDGAREGGYPSDAQAKLISSSEINWIDIFFSPPMFNALGKLECEAQGKHLFFHLCAFLRDIVFEQGKMKKGMLKEVMLRFKEYAKRITSPVLPSAYMTFMAKQIEYEMYCNPDIHKFPDYTFLFSVESVKDSKKLRICDGAQEDMKNFVEEKSKLREMLEWQNKDIHKKKLIRTQLINLCDNEEKYRNLCALWKFEAADVTALYQEFKDLLEEIGFLSDIIGQLQGIGITFMQNLKNLHNQVRLCDLTGFCDNRRAAFGLSQDMFEKVRSVFFQKSNLFIHFMKEEVRRLRDSKADMSSSKCLPVAFEQTLQVIERVFDMKEKKLSDLDDLVGVVQMRDPTEEINTLLRLFATFQRGKELSSGVSVKELTKYVEYGKELRGYEEVFKNLAEVNKKFEFFGENGLHDFNRVAKKITKDLELKKAKSALSKLAPLIGELSVPEFRVFKVMDECSPLVNFFMNAENYDEHAAILQNQLSSNQHDSSLLNSTTGVNRFLRPFLLLRNVDKSTIVFSEFCKTLKASLQSYIKIDGKKTDYTLLDAMYVQMKEVNEQINTVEGWFANISSGMASIENIHRTLDNFMTRGVYYSSVDNVQPCYLSLTTYAEGKEDAKSSQNSTYISDLIRAMRLFASSGSDEEETEDMMRVREFVSINNFAEKIHEVRIELMKNGHPNFQHSHISLNAPNKNFNSLAFMRKFQFIDNILKTWVSSLEEVRAKTERFCFLSSHQLLNFLNGVKTACETSDKKIIAEALYPFVFACFPDFIGFESKFNANSDPIADKFIELYEQRKEEIKQSKSNELSIAYLKLASDYTLAVENVLSRYPSASGDLLLESSTNEGAVCGKESLSVLSTKEFTQNQIYISMFNYFNSNKPHFSRVFYCNDKTTGDEIAFFVKRIEVFHGLTYAIMNPNVLSAGAKDTLLHWAMKVSADDSPRNYGRTYLVFSEDRGIELFDFINQEDLSEDRYLGVFRDLKNKEFGQDISSKRNIISLEYFTDEPQCGKSTHIAKLVKERNRVIASVPIYFSVTDDFVGQKFIIKVREAIQKNPNAKRFSLIIGVSCYAPFKDFGNFFTNFLMFGVLNDEHTGEIYYPPKRLQWHMYIEIQRAPKEDPEFGKCSTQMMVGSLPMIEFLGTCIADSGMQEYILEPFEHVSVVFYSMMKGDIGRFRKMRIFELNNEFDKMMKIVKDGKGDEMVEEYIAYLMSLRSEDGTESGKFIQKRVSKVLSRKLSILKAFMEILATSEAGLYSHPLDIAEELFEEVVFVQNVPLGLPHTMVDGKERVAYTSCTEYGFTTLDFSDTKSTYHSASLSLEEAIENSVDLNRIVGNEFGSDSISDLLDDCNYVLTPEFAIKLLLLNECRQSNNNVILFGGTGTGKSEILRLFSLLLNFDSSIVPKDFLECVMEELKKKVAQDYPECADKIVREKMGERKETREKDIAKLKQWMDEFVTKPPKAFEEKAETLRTEGKHVSAAGRALEYLSGMLHGVIFTLIKRYPVLRLEGKAANFFALGQDAICASWENNKNVALTNLQSVFTSFVNTRPDKLFHHILMHQHISAEKFRSKIRSIIAQASKFRSSSSTEDEKTKFKQPTCVVFIDECTCTNIMSLVNEVICNHSIDGEPIPRNIFFVGAYNRNDLEKYEEAERDRQKKLDESAQKIMGIAHSPIMEPDRGTVTVTDYTLNTTEERQKFAVRRPSDSMAKYEFSFLSLTSQNQKVFLKKLIRMRFNKNARKGLFAGEDVSHFDDIELGIMLGQEYMGKKKERVELEGKASRVDPSIRDIVRAMRLYNYFRKNSFWITPEMREYMTMGASKDHHEHLGALVLSCAIAYAFRLGPRGDWYRNEYINHVTRRVFKDFKEGEDPFNKILDIAMRHVFVETRPPKGIAPISAILENLFATVACIDAKVPAVVFGPPGCSKTLSFTLAMQSMKGSASPSPFFARMKRTSPIRCQCSEQSTDKEIKSIFEIAIRSQETANRTCKKEDRIRSVVLLDEAGLTHEKEAPLKVLHYLLDHPQVSCIILTNTMLDAAKTNRAALVQQSSPENADLVEMAKNIIFLGAEMNKFEVAVPTALCEAFNKISNKDKKYLENVEDMFHLRDYVYLCRYISRFRSNAVSQEFFLTPNDLAMALRRNIGGPTEPEFREIVKVFFASMQNAFGAAVPECWKTVDGATFELPSVLDALRESLAEEVKENENLNESAFRDVMVVDSSDNEIAISSLFQMGILNDDKTKTCKISDFAEDQNDDGKALALTDIKESMEKGDVIVLHNAMPISASIYDVLNRNFSMLTEKGKTRYFANIAIGRFSQQCVFNPKFRIVTYLPASSVRKTPRPFLNRFEKYYISIETIMNETVSEKMTEEQKDQLIKTREGCEDMIQKLHVDHGSKTFNGLVPGETLNSLLFEAAIKTQSARGTPLMVSPPHHMAGAYAEQTLQNEDRARIRTVNYRILQLAPPESIFMLKELPDEYKREYIMRQEHFSICDFLKDLVTKNEKGADVRKKWCVYTRSTGDIASFHRDATVRELVLKNVVSNPERIEQTCRVISSNEYSTSDKFVGVLDAAMMEADLSLLICTIDMNVSTASRINLVKSIVDKGLKARASAKLKEPVVALILHFPAEKEFLGTKHATHSIFANNWEYISIDALGVSIVTKHEESGASTKEARKDLDPRFWIGYALGLGEVDMEKFQKEFKGKFFEYLGTNVESAWHKASHRRNFKGLTNTSAKFFARSLRKKAIPPRFKELLDQVPELLDDIINRLPDLWCGRMVSATIMNTCFKIENGTVTSSFIQAIQDSLEKLLAPLSKTFAEVVWSNYSVENIARLTLKERLENQREKRLVEKEKLLMGSVISVLPVPSFEEITAPRSAVEKDEDISVQNTKNFPSFLPFFDYIARRIDELLSEVFEQGGASDKYTIANALKNKMAVDPISQPVSIILRSNYLTNLYKRDFLLRKLHMDKFFYMSFEELSDPKKNLWLKILVSFIDKLCENEAGSAMDIYALHCLPKFHTKDVNFIASCIGPIQNLTPAATMEEVESLGAIANVNDFESIMCRFATVTVDVLWSRMEKGCTDPAVLSSCLKGFRDFASGIGARYVVHERIEDMQSRKKFDMLNIMTMFMTNVEPKYEIAMQAIAAVLKSMNLAAGERVTYENALNVVFALVAFHSKLVKDSSIEKAHAFMFEVSRFIFDAPKSMYEEPISIDMKYLCSVLCGNCDKNVKVITDGEAVGLLSLLKDVITGRSSIAAEECIENLKEECTGGRMSDVVDMMSLVVKKKAGSNGMFLPEYALLHIIKNAIDIMYREYVEVEDIAMDSGTMFGFCKKKYSEAALPIEKVAYGAYAIEKMVGILSEENRKNADDALAALSDNFRSVFTAMVGDSAILNVPEYFVSKFGDEKRMIKILQNQKLMQMLKMEDYYVDAQLEEMNFSLPPFMIEENHKYNPLFTEVKESMLGLAGKDSLDVLLEKKLRDNNECIRCQLRMFVVLVMFYEFFFNGRPAKPVQDHYVKVKQLLRITDLEEPLFRLFLDGPRRSTDVDERKKTAFYQFTYEAMHDKERDISHTLFTVNLIAFTLGCPPRSTHMYPRMLDIKSSENTHCPGSDYGSRNNWDCGFKFNFAGGDPQFGSNNPNPPIMRNKKEYRLLLNSITWTCYGVAMILDPQRNSAIARSMSWMTSHMDEEYFHPSLDPVEQVVELYRRRGYVFYTALQQNEELRKQGIDPQHLMNEVLIELFDRCTGFGNVERREQILTMGNYRSMDDCLRYENVFEQIIDNKIQNYPALKEEFANAVSKLNAKLGQMMSIRNSTSTFIHSPFFDVNDFVTFTADNKTFEDVFTVFKGDAMKLWCLKHINVVIQFYLDLHRIASFRVTKEEAKSMTMSQLVERVRETSVVDAKALKERWDNLKAIWPQLSANVATEICASAAAGRAFEADRIALNEDTVLQLLLTYSKGETEGGHILRMIDDLCKNQNSLIDATIKLIKSDSALWNPAGLVMSEDSLDENPDKKTNMYALPTDPNYLSRLCTFDLAGESELDETVLTPFVATCCKFNPSTCVRSERTFDRVAVDKFVMKNFVSGRSKMYAEDLRQIIVFRTEGATKASEESPAGPKQMSFLGQFVASSSVSAYETSLKLAVDRVRDIFKNVVEWKEDTKYMQLLLRTSKFGLPQLNGLAEIVKDVLEEMVRQSKYAEIREDSKAWSKMTIGEFFHSALHNTMSATYKKFHGVELVKVCNLADVLLEWMSGRAYMLSDLPEVFNVPLDPKRIEELVSEFESFAEATGQRAASDLEGLTTKFLETRELLYNLSADSADQPITDISRAKLGQHYEMLTEQEIQLKSILNIGQIPAKNYNSLMRTLFGMVSKNRMQLASEAMMAAVGDAADTVVKYAEHVPGAEDEDMDEPAVRAVRAAKADAEVAPSDDEDAEALPEYKKREEEDVDMEGGEEEEEESSDGTIWNITFDKQVCEASSILFPTLKSAFVNKWGDKPVLFFRASDLMPIVEYCGKNAECIDPMMRVTESDIAKTRHPVVAATDASCVFAIFEKRIVSMPMETTVATVKKVFGINMEGNLGVVPRKGDPKVVSNDATLGAIRKDFRLTKKVEFVSM